MASRGSEPAPRPPGGGPPGLQGPSPARFAELYRTWYSTVVTEALHHLGSSSDAEDVAQCVFTRLLKNGGWWDIAHPESYFRQAARHEALSLMRDRGEAVALDPELAERFPDPSADPLRPVRRDEARSLVQAALDRFPQQCGRVCERKWLRQLSRREIADELGISTKAVGKQLARGRRLLAEAGVVELLSSFEDGGGVRRFLRLMNRRVMRTSPRSSSRRAEEDPEVVQEWGSRMARETLGLERPWMTRSRRPSVARFRERSSGLARSGIPRASDCRTAPWQVRTPAHRATGSPCSTTSSTSGWMRSSIRGWGMRTCCPTTSSRRGTTWCFVSAMYTKMNSIRRARPKCFYTTFGFPSVRAQRRRGAVEVSGAAMESPR